MQDLCVNKWLMCSVKLQRKLGWGDDHIKESVEGEAVQVGP
jgi:hypothetical protein